jgi:hypothetical protein
MSNRVVLGAFDGTYVLRVSRPGFDVLDPNLAKELLAFDSRWDEAGNVYMTGSGVIPTGPGSSQTATIDFGATIDPPPLAIGLIEASGPYLGTGYHLMSNMDGAMANTGFQNSIVTTTTQVKLISTEEGKPFFYAVLRNVYG